MDRDTWEWIKEGFMKCKICDRWLDRHELMDVGVGHTICIECYEVIKAYVLNHLDDINSIQDEICNNFIRKDEIYLYNETAIKEMLKVANKMIEDYKYNRYKSACLAKVAMDHLKKFFDAIRSNDIDNARKYLEKATHVWHMAV